MVIECVGLINKLLTSLPGAFCSPTQLYATWSFDMVATSNQMASVEPHGVWMQQGIPLCICYEMTGYWNGERALSKGAFSNRIPVWTKNDQRSMDQILSRPTL